MHLRHHRAHHLCHIINRRDMFTAGKSHQCADHPLQKVGKSRLSSPQSGVKIEEENIPVAALPGPSDMLLLGYEVIDCILLPLSVNSQSFSTSTHLHAARKSSSSACCSHGCMSPTSSDKIFNLIRLDHFNLKLHLFRYTSNV